MGDAARYPGEPTAARNQVFVLLGRGGAVETQASPVRAQPSGSRGRPAFAKEFSRRRRRNGPRVGCSGARQKAPSTSSELASTHAPSR